MTLTLRILDDLADLGNLGDLDVCGWDGGGVEKGPR